MGAVLREQNALPYGGWITVKLTAKDDVDNVGAGRAAKGENPSACANKKCPIGALFFVGAEGGLEESPRCRGFARGAEKGNKSFSTRVYRAATLWQSQSSSACAKNMEMDHLSPYFLFNGDAEGFEGRASL